ncbi:peptide N-acetyl-beta-D-glucosaminyl asparaginase amidase A-domain-containing protein [Dichotomopilus funicola]|uniref:Peptide N-acetyl-beta-D-glucosaminyl asparaginase amidase A-domain-containing protein n=1 Tax=Dichotomopilus funicola TaxID=1934379 RepID=A0AAN6V3W2_9PEZI|nr:peptide N-acetyl-beta-D-glucosaminyl asparaginase amidase A-domain-containing protein [Dichotomopilus funicola]
MASIDVEKRAILAAEDFPTPDTKVNNTSRSRRNTRYFLALILGGLALLSIAITSQRCSATTSLFTSHAVSQHHHIIHHDAELDSLTHVTKKEVGVTAATATTSTAAPGRTVLKNFEVAQPVLLPGGPTESDGSTKGGDEGEVCSVLLMRHDFAFSYGAPFVGDYTPPDCDFNRAVLNFSVVSQGRQFDRLAIMYFGDTEVWRTSTAEPTAPPGISWIYLKDMTQYLYFWKSPQRVIFDLGNLVDDTYTGIFNTTMTAIFYKADVDTDQAPPSDLILPISARQGAKDSISRFILPEENASNTISLPRNIQRAVFSVSANGQATEEFWWSNVPQTDVATFNKTAGELPGLSPFREVQVLIDGQLAGVQWPFPVVFTGGVVPSLHRPIAGIHAFDLREHEIDITPFLGLLCDGKDHTFTIRVAGLDNSASGGDGNTATLTETVNESWYVTGKLFLWLNPDSDAITAGDPPAIDAPPPKIEVTRSLAQGEQAAVGGRIASSLNKTLHYTTSVKRALRITSGSASWTQTLSYTNDGLVADFGSIQINDMTLSGTDVADKTDKAKGQEGYYRATYAYPLFCNSSYGYTPAGNLSISGHLRQGKEVSVFGASVFATGLEAFAQVGGDRSKGLKGKTSKLSTTKEGTAEFRQAADGSSSTGWGEARQVFWFGLEEGDSTEDADEVGGGKGRGEELYYREVAAVNGTLTEDVKRIEGVRVGGDGSERRVLDTAATEFA